MNSGRRQRAWPAFAACVLCCCLSSPASAAVLYDRTAGAGVDGVPSQESLDDPAMTTQAADTFEVPYGQHWALTELGLLGSSTAPANRPLNVSVHEEFGARRLGPGRELFSARGLPTTGAPNYTVALQGVPLLDPGTYWISAQEVGVSSDPWRWLPHRAGPDRSGVHAVWQNPGNGLGTDCIEWWPREGCLALPAGESHQAFKLSGTFKQVVRAGSWGNSGRVVSSPPGIDCPPACTAAFDRGTVVTLTGLPLLKNTEFTGWRRGVELPPTSIPPSTPAPTDLPCPDPGKGPCRWTLNEDVTLYGTYQLASRVGFGKLKRHLGEGTAKLFLRLRVAGALSLTSGGVKPYREQEAKPSLVRVPLIPKGEARRRLAATGEAKVALRIKFRAAGNIAATFVRKVTLRQKLDR